MPRTHNKISVAPLPLFMYKARKQRVWNLNSVWPRSPCSFHHRGDPWATPRASGILRNTALRMTSQADSHMTVLADALPTQGFSEFPWVTAWKAGIALYLTGEKTKEHPESLPGPHLPASHTHLQNESRHGRFHCV